ncbi:hypothetical protein [Saccharothrix yanglingensis]|uniref:hypothetical protein n=1 Tax=Saccharothrix yanglingensis TaxID=659496 RepID=UPI0027D2A7B7|nr:hypothetical protein [Saccharothrix yanglingensis]
MPEERQAGVGHVPAVVGDGDVEAGHDPAVGIVGDLQVAVGVLRVLVPHRPAVLPGVRALGVLLHERDDVPAGPLDDRARLLLNEEALFFTQSGKCTVPRCSGHSKQPPW